jgi:hypothetical protein
LDLNLEDAFIEYTRGSKPFLFATNDKDDAVNVSAGSKRAAPS